MTLKAFFETFLGFVPPQVMRIVAGGIALGLVLMLFLKVVDEVFDLSVPWLNGVAVLVTLLFAMLLCSGSEAWRQRLMNFGCGAVVIFAVGLTSNNVVAEMRETFGLASGAESQPSDTAVGDTPSDGPPDPVADLETILTL